MTFPYTPVAPSTKGCLAFACDETGEILEFAPYYLSNLDLVEAVLMEHQQDMGSYHALQRPGSHVIQMHNTPMWF